MFFFFSSSCWLTKLQQSIIRVTQRSREQSAAKQSDAKWAAAALMLRTCAALPSHPHHPNLGISDLRSIPAWTRLLDLPAPPRITWTETWSDEQPGRLEAAGRPILLLLGSRDFTPTVGAWMGLCVKWLHLCGKEGAELQEAVSVLQSFFVPTLTYRSWWVVIERQRLQMQRTPAKSWFTVCRLCLSHIFSMEPNYWYFAENPAFLRKPLCLELVFFLWVLKLILVRKYHFVT